MARKQRAMKAWMARWNDGTTSIVVAASREEACEVLDEIGAFEACDLIPITVGFFVTFKPETIPSDDEVPFVHMVPTGEGSYSLDEQIMEKCYPSINALDFDAGLEETQAALAGEMARRPQSKCEGRVAHMDLSSTVARLWSSQKESGLTQ